MIGNNPDRGLIREYLLGRLDDDEAAEMKMSEDILFDDELAEVVESVEEEIMEAYLDAALDAADRKSVEEYFLQPPERQQKLRFIRLLDRQFTSRQEPAVSDEARTSSDSDTTQKNRSNHESAERFVWWRSPFWIYGQVAALIIFGVVSASYVALMHRKQTVLDRELDQERARIVSLRNEVSQLQPEIVVLSLVPGRSRSGGGSEEARKHLELKTSTKQIVVAVALRHSVAVAYSVRVEARGSRELVWTATLLPIVSAEGDGRLVFDLPAEALHSGAYSLGVSEAAGNRAIDHYEFDVTAPR